MRGGLWALQLPGGYEAATHALKGLSACVPPAATLALLSLPAGLCPGQIMGALGGALQQPRSAWELRGGLCGQAWMKAGPEEGKVKAKQLPVLSCI